MTNQQQQQPPFIFNFDGSTITELTSTLVRCGIPKLDPANYDRWSGLYQTTLKESGALWCTNGHNPLISVHFRDPIPWAASIDFDRITGRLSSITTWTDEIAPACSPDCPAELVVLAAWPSGGWAWVRDESLHQLDVLRRLSADSGLEENPHWVPMNRPAR